ncbi:MAG: BglG family transcription antiterminator [Anaeromicrobium sp.]|jgi:transcriptional antiterminator/mannitol/fructose-specific phosphotransferase system IIA component (Ntr-type)|uniref:BglG family transcription antiterminator n=1 Tax=Anaeromicrobium sp. TaxID=1929132 RepID=UPI0025EF2583|nr:BglG family transcription antiterminator [Anaeromicrobium sp.]MCT4594757.1 BglG family transcription antiterminator [Anaeromicrobium sp.]
MTLKNRTLQQIIDILNSDTYIPYSFFTTKYNISERSLRNDLTLIDKWLSSKKLPILKRNKFEGIFLDVTPLIKNRIIGKFKDLSLKLYVKNSYERSIFILIELFFKDSMTLYQLSDSLNVSRNSILKDLKWIESYVKNFNCKLEKKKRVGLYIEGSEYNIRNMYINLLIDHCQLDRWDIFSNEIIDENYDFFYRKLINRIFECLDKTFLINTMEALEEHLSLKYTDRSKYMTMAAMAVTKCRVLNGKYISFNKILFYETLKISKEYRVLKDLLESSFNSFKSWNKEIAYISIYLLTKRVLDGSIEENSFDNLKEIVHNMIKIMEDYSNTKIKNREKLLKGLVLHLEPAIYRMKYGIHIENSSIDHIKTKYTSAYNASKMACSFLGEQLKLTIPEEEICYVAIHFGSAIETQNKIIQTNVVLVCNAGISTVKVLEKSLEENFSNFKIINILSYFEYMRKKDLISDLIISTIPLKEKDHRFIQVNPFLTKEDIDKLSGYLVKKKEIEQESKSLDLKDIIGVVKKYCNIYDEKKLTEELDFLLKGMKQPSLLDLISKDRFHMIDSINTWENSIDLASSPLLADGIITENYINVMKNNINRLRAYVVIKKGVAIPHAKPNDGALKLGFSLLLIKKGVNFNHKKNDPVNVVLVTSSLDRISHLKALNEFLDIVKKDTNMKKLMKVNNYSEFKELIEILLKKDNRRRM